MNRTLKRLNELEQAYFDVRKRIDNLLVGGEANTFYVESRPYTRSGPQRTFQVPEYPPGEDVLEVYVDGTRKFKDVDYTEDSPTQITFLYDILEQCHL